MLPLLGLLASLLVPIRAAADSPDLPVAGPILSVLARHRYIAPTGSDSNPGTRDLPWRTWAFALGQLHPGDSLVARDGVYSQSTTGIPTITCGSNARNGTALLPIRIRAERERKAVLEAGGTIGPTGRTWTAFTMQGCSWWKIEGLRLEGSDAPDSASSYNNFGAVAHIYESSNIDLARLFVRRNNRYANHHLILIQESADVLVESSEVYEFCRHAISVVYGRRITLRRNYVNANFYPTIPFQWDSPPGPDCTTNGGAIAIVLYPAEESVVENNIAEHNGYGFLSIETPGSPGAGSNNRFLGNVGLDNHRDLTVDNRSMAQSSIRVVNHVAVNPRTVAFWTTNGVKGLECENCSLIDGRLVYGAPRGVELDDFDGVSDDAVLYRNVLVINHPREAFHIPGTWARCDIEYTTSYNNSPNFPESGCTLTNVSAADPNAGEPPGDRVGIGYGECIVYIPSGNAALKGTGSLGADRGANVVYRYRNGLMTAAKLWHPSSGAFPCGSDVLGAGDRCQNVNERLNVGANGCPTPYRRPLGLQQGPDLFNP